MYYYNSDIICTADIIANRMDENTKKKIKMVRELIDKKNYQEALDQAEIIVYKNSKIFQAHLMAGFCYDKLNKYHEAEKSFLQVLDLKPEEPNAIKALCDLYTKMGNVEKSTKYMESMLAILKNTDPLKYRQNLVKLVLMYQKTLDMQKIDKIFQQLLLSQNEITQQFIAIAEAYFRTAVTNQCFFLDSFLPLGIKGQVHRVLQPNAKQRLNHLLIQIVRYLYSVKLDFKMTNKDIANSIYQMKQCFPYASCFLMLYLLDEYCISQTAFNGVILQQIYLFLAAFFDKVDNCYLNIQTLQPECFVVSAVLSYEFLAFMKEFFILDEVFNPYFDKLAATITDIQSRKVREQYAQKISRFILKQCRNVSKISETQNIENRLQSLKYRIVKLDGSYLEEVVAKMAMNCFVNYQKLSDMKNLLKTRINNLTQGQVQPHLYKYYYDYLIKIAKLYKALDEQISIYDVINYIKKNDTIDLKYLVEYNWIEFGKHSKDDLQKFKEAANQSLKNVEQLLPRLTGSLKSQTIRRRAVLKIFLEQHDEVLDEFKLALGTDRTFENLQCIGFYYFLAADYERSLRYLKQAFVIRQDQYHVNRVIFISMMKLNEHKDAYGFLQRIYEGFPNVYWINYALAMNAINSKKIESAYKYLSGALEAFLSGVGKTFKFSYQKTIQGEQYSLLYMIDQNKFHILLDEVVIPQKKIYELFPMTSSLFFECKTELKQIRIETQLGELLKLQGRNKSSYNHLASAHQILQSLPQQTKKQNILQVISTKKQYATMLFYVRAYKQSEQIFKKTLRICQENESANIQKQLMTVYQSEINSLLFQVSVMRLDELMKFESYEAVDEYISKFTQDLNELKDLVKKPSLNYYKAKYQFYILCFLHNKKLGIEKSLQTIEDYLRFFGLNSKQVQTDGFYNRLVELKNQERIIVKQCLQDYFVLKYMKQNSEDSTGEGRITAENVLPLIQLFPTSSVFYIVYAMAVEETKLKIAAFLKCIQLDRESPISIDLLASLFLKQKDYLTACKLFLKSLQIDLFSTKSYIGLCTCLYVLIGSAIKRGSAEDNQIIRKALNKINSYMEFLRIVDPSQNYHMLKFLKTLISDEPIPLFELKAGLEQSRKLTAHKYSHKLLYRLLEDSTQYLKDFNVWKTEGRAQVLKKYLQKNNAPNGDIYEMGKSIIDRIQIQTKQHQLPQVKSGEIRIKIKCKILNKICIAGNLFSRSQKFSEQDLQRYIKLCQLMEQPGLNKDDDELTKLQKTAKQIILSTVIKTEKLKKNNGSVKILDKIKQLNKHRVYKNIPTFAHIQVYLDQFTQSQFLSPMKRYIFSSMHSHPTDPILRKALVSWLVVVEKQNNKNTKKIKQSMDYRLEGAIQMNSDEQASNTSRFHKKYALMFNIQQPNGWVGYIAGEWQKKKQPKWIGHLNKILSVYSDKQNKLTPQSREKATWLLIQMNAIKLNKKQNVETKQFLPNSQGRIESLSSIFSNKDSNFGKQKIGLLFKNIPGESQMHLMKYIVPSLVKNYKHSPELQKILDACIENSKDPKMKGFYTLLKFISISSLPATNEDQLINQLKQMLNIIVECQPKQNTKIHPNSIVAMKCMVALFSLNYEQLQAELNAALNFRLASYSDTVLINFFEMIRLFREVQQNHQGQNVFESFTEYVNLMLTIVKQPVLKGFFTALKAMANAIVAQESASKLSRQLKYAMLLSPPSGKSILSKQNI